MKPYLLLLSLLLCVLVACSTDEAVEITTTSIPTEQVTVTSDPTLPTKSGLTRNTATVEIKVTKTLTNTPAPTQTKAPTKTAANTPTQTFTPSSTATYNVTDLVTHTPAAPEQCPIESPELRPDFSAVYEYNVSYLPNVQPILDFLNAGGTRQVAGNELNRYYSQFANSLVQDQYFQEVDVTGDGVPDILVVVDWQWFVVLRCQSGEYQEILEWRGQSTNKVELLFVEDLNLNGVPEIVIYDRGCMGDKCHSIEMLEWDGTQFEHLIDW